MQKASSLISLLLSLLIFFACVTAVPLSVSFPVSASDNPVSINDLIENMAKYDNKAITLSGEAIGECLERDNGDWINISDGGNAIGVWMSKADAAQIKIYGDYKHTGDMITVTGTFYQASPTDGGEPDIHCTYLVINATGVGRTENISTRKIIAAVASVTVAIALFMAYQKKLVKKEDPGE